MMIIRTTMSMNYELRFMNYVCINQSNIYLYILLTYYLFLYLYLPDTATTYIYTYIIDKISVMTFHRSKGIERKVVIALLFNKSYFDYYAKGESRDICPNPMYVAITRSLEILILSGMMDNNSS